MTEDPYYTDSIIRPGCQHFRLREGQTTKGFLQINAKGSKYYSKDNFWWRNSPIEFTEQDRSTESFDANRQMIFEHDLVVLKKSLGGDYTKRGLILWDEASRGFVINLLEEGQVNPFPQTDAAAPFLNELKVTGQLFG